MQDLRNVHFKAMSGSQAYGLSTPESDEDWRGFYIPPTVDWFKLGEPAEQLQTTKNEDYAYWELKKFFNLVIKNNPNVLESLWSPIVEYPHPETRDVIETFIVNNRNNFLSKRMIDTYGGYATSQLKRGEEYVARGKTREGWKHLMHLCRLLIQGTGALLDRELKVDVGEYRDKLLDIRNERVSMEDFKKWHSELEIAFNEAKLVTILPDEVNQKPIIDFMITMRMMLLDIHLLERLKV